MDAPWLIEALPKALLYAFLQVAIGSSVVNWLLRRSKSDLSFEIPTEIQRKLSRLARIATAVVLLALFVRLIAHTLVAMGDLQWQNVRLIALESRWGSSWKIQLLFAALQLLAAFALRQARGMSWLVFAISSLFFCATVPLLGHGSGSSGRFLLHFVHLMATSIWLGTLSAIVFVRADRTKGLMSAFSPIALISAVIVGASGAIAASLYVVAPDNLLITSYGRMLLVKLVFFAGVLACGWTNWRRVKVAAPAPVWTVRLELLCAVLVVIVTGILTEMEHP